LARGNKEIEMAKLMILTLVFGPLVWGLMTLVAAAGL